MTLTWRHYPSDVIALNIKMLAIGVTLTWRHYPSDVIINPQATLRDQLLQAKLVEDDLLKLGNTLKLIN